MKIHAIAQTFAQSGFAILFAALVPSLAQAAPTVVLDSKGMPRCIQSDSASQPSLLLAWNPTDRFARDVLAVPMDAAFQQRITVYYKPANPHVAPRATPDLNCSSWEAFSKIGLDVLKGTVIPANATQADGFSLTDGNLPQALAEIRVAANEYHAEKDGVTWLANHPIRSFTTDINRQLTARFGAGFTGEIYQAWIMSFPKNAAFRNAVMAQSRFVSRQSDGFIAGRFGNRTIVYVKGLGHELAAAQRFDVMVEELKAIGAPVVTVDTPSFDPVRSNAARIGATVDQVLSQGRDVILISLSKGGLESLLALSQLRPKLEGSSHAPGYGYVHAFISMSGVMAPSFLVSFVSGLPQWLIAQYELQKEYTDEGLSSPSVSGLKDLNSSRLPQIMAEIQKNGIPQTPIYVNLVGAREGDGLAKDPTVRELQDSVVRRLGSYIGPYGANDGYVEYPGTQLPPGTVANQYVLAVDGSHALIDGEVDGLQLSDPKVVREFMGGTLLQIIKEADGVSNN